MSFPFIVEQRAGQGRTVILQGRSLPYRPVSWGGTQRRDKNWFTGNPVATLQVLGPTLKDTTITGKWKDIFLADDGNAALLLNFPKLSPLTQVTRTERRVDGGQTFVSGDAITQDQRARRARVLRDAFELIRIEGQLLRVEWGSIARFGILKETDFGHDREEDIGFEMIFDWIGTTDAQRVITPRGFEPLGALRQFLAQLNAFLDEILRTLAANAFRAEDFVRRVNAQITKLGSFVTELLGTLERFVALDFAPSDLLGTVRGNLRAIRLAALELIGEIDQESAAIAASFSGDPAQVAAAMAFEQAIRFAAERFAGEAAAQEREIQLSVADELLGTFTSPGGVTLRDVATRFYGSPENWTKIQEFNNLTVSVLPRGLIVRVPKL